LIDLLTWHADRAIGLSKDVQYACYGLIVLAILQIRLSFSTPDYPIDKTPIFLAIVTAGASLIFGWGFQLDVIGAVGDVKLSELNEDVTPMAILKMNIRMLDSGRFAVAEIYGMSQLAFLLISAVFLFLGARRMIALNLIAFSISVLLIAAIFAYIAATANDFQWF